MDTQSVTDYRIGENRDTPCSVPCCTHGRRTQGMCGMHYQRLRNSGTTDSRYRPKPPWKTCSILGCDKQSRTRLGKHCEMHYYRFRLRGTYDDPVRGLYTITDHGYLSKLAHGHPIASKSGMLYQHREVLFEKIGEGRHSCHWCKEPVTWRAKGKDKLVVDHVDGNKQNNHISNLVPACHRCNSNRGLFMNWVIKHSNDPFLWSLYESARRAA